LCRANELKAGCVHVAIIFANGCLQIRCSQDATTAGNHSSSDVQRNAVSESDTLGNDDLVDSATHGTTTASSSSSSGNGNIAIGSVISSTALARETSTAGGIEAGK
jgi:hypothetical protein